MVHMELADNAGQRYWFVIRTKTGSEHTASELLRQKGYECLLPTYVDRFLRSSNAKQPLFPGYIFCRLLQFYGAKLITTPTVIDFVRFGGKPALVDEKEIATLRIVEASILSREPAPWFTTGNRVRIETGPLRGAVGIFHRSGRAGCFLVLVSLLRRSVRVVLPPDCILSRILDPPGEVPASRS